MSIPSWARVGAKVVCRRASIHRHSIQRKLAPNVPIVGQIYTIRGLYLFDCGQWGVTLDEVINPAQDTDWGEAHFEIYKFAPLVTLDDDLKAHFAHLLDAPLRVSEEA